MKRVIKILSVIMATVMFFSVFTAANPAIAAEIQEAELTEESQTTEASESTDNGEAEVEILNEITDLRDEYTKHFRQSDGSYVAAEYSSPVHYLKNGKWVEYDFTLKEKSLSEDVYTPASTDIPVEFPSQITKDGNNEISVDVADTTISFAPKKSQKGLKTASGDVVQTDELVSAEISNTDTVNTFSLKREENSEKEESNPLGVDKRKGAFKYDNVFNNVSLEYELSGNVLKESIVLEKAQGKNAFEFTMDFGGLYPRKEQDGSIVLYTDSGCTMAQSVIAPPYMIDSKGVCSEDVSMELTPDGDKYTLTVTADKNWLDDNKRVYPVIIDPTIILDINRQNTIDCYVDNSSPNASYPYDYYLYAGHSTLGKTRTFVKFNLPELPDECCVIQDARLQIYQMSVDAGSEKRFISVHTVTENWNNTTLSPTWNDQPEFAATALDYAELTYDCGDRYHFDITRAAKSWFENGNNYGVVIKGYDESKVGRAQIISAEYNITDVVYPTILVTYRNNKGLENYWSYSSYGAGTAGTANINDYTGNLVYSLPILSSSGALMPLALSATYNNYCANERLTVGKNNSSRTTPGKGFRLSIQETVLPSDKYGLTGENKENYPYVYTDGDGTEHYIKKVKEKDKDGKETTVYKDEDGLNLTLKLDGECSYILTDKAGTQRWFNSKGNLLKILDANGNEIHIYFKPASTADNLEEKSRISYITDGSGHKFTFTYYEDKGVELDYIKTIKDNAGRTIYFTTTGGFLRSVKYYDETVTKIVYEGENSSTPEYEESAEGLINYVLSNDGYGLNFDYTTKATGRRVKKVKEFGTSANGTFKSGQIVTFDRTEYNTTLIRSAGIDGFHYESDNTKGDDDIITTLQFDNSGRTVAQQIKYGNGSMVGAGSYDFTDSSGEAASLGSKNRVSSTGSMGKSVVNLLTGGNAESTTGWTHSASSPAVATEKYMGTKSLKLSVSGLTGSGNTYYRQKAEGLTKGGTYTLSAYVKVGSVSAAAENKYTGAHLQINTVGTDGVTDEPVRSEVISETTDTGIDNGWRRITATVTIPEDTASTYVYLCLRNMNGTAYFDCIQLESGSVANSFNILENSSFEKSSNGLPTGWSAINTSYSTSSNGTVTDGITTAAKANGTKSVRITGEPDVAKGYSQKIYVDGKAEETYIVSGWAKAAAVNSTFHSHYEQDGVKITDEKANEILTNTNEKDDEAIELVADTKLEIAVKVTYDRTDKDKNVTEVSQYKDSAAFNTTITSWQYASTPFSLEYAEPEEGCSYTPKYFQIVPRYCRQVNYVYFDHLMLVREPSQTYTYDKEGNLLKATANSEQKANAQYDDNDNMASYTDTLGNTTTMHYDDKHNLTHTTSEKGVTTGTAYNTNGTVSVSELRNTLKHDDATLAIRTNKEYHTGGEAYGINDGAYLKYYYDEHGNATHYTYNWATGAPKTTTDANGVTTTNKYYAYQDVNGKEITDYTRLESVSTGSSKVTYTYDQTLTGKYGGNRMSSILFGSATKGETYSFKFDEYGNTTSTYVGTQPLSTNTYKGNNGVLELTTYGNDDKIEYTYNNLGLVTTRVKTGKSSTTYKWKYDATGTLLAYTDSGTGYKYTYAYDSLGRAIRQNVTMYAGDNAGAPVSFTENVYDKANNLTKLINNVGGRTITQEYSYSALPNNTASEKYAKDNLPTQYSLASNRKVTYDYDSLSRLNQYTLSLGTPIYVNYTYKMSDRNTGGSELYRTTQLSTEFINNDTYTYYYDSVGNITSIKKGERKSTDPDSVDFKKTDGAVAYRSYEYDDLYQLTRENNKSANETKVWEYDDLGNIESVTIYPYSTTTLSTATKTVTYDYGQENDTTADDDGTGWNNILLGVDLNGNGTYETDEKISYDAIGNPEKYLGNDLLWTCRELYRYENDRIRNTYYYDSDGLRSRKNMYVSNENGGYTYNGKVMYQYLGGLLTYQCTYNSADEADNEMYFFYDSYSKLTAIRYIKGSINHYYYVTTNKQGDVLGIYSASGALLASYDYDAWGNCTVNTVNSNYTIGNDNPIRYRSYYYDTDTGLYYLQSRYYNPEIGRFLNSDNVSDSSAEILGYNFYIYCGNNPIVNYDPTGHGIIKNFIKKVYKGVMNTVRNTVGKLNVAANISQNLNLQIGNVTVGIAVGVSQHANGDVSGNFNVTAGGTVSTSSGGIGVSSQTCVGLDFIPDFDSVLDSGSHVSVGISAPIPKVPISGESSISFNDYTGKNGIYNGFSLDTGISFPKGSPGLNASVGFDNSSSVSLGNVYDVYDAFFVTIMGE